MNEYVGFYERRGEKRTRRALWFHRQSGLLLLGAIDTPLDASTRAPLGFAVITVPPGPERVLSNGCSRTPSTNSVVTAMQASSARQAAPASLRPTYAGTATAPISSTRAYRRIRLFPIGPVLKGTARLLANTALPSNEGTTPTPPTGGDIDRETCVDARELRRQRRCELLGPVCRANEPAGASAAATSSVVLAGRRLGQRIPRRDVVNDGHAARSVGEGVLVANAWKRGAVVERAR